MQSPDTDLDDRALFKALDLFNAVERQIVDAEGPVAHLILRSRARAAAAVTLLAKADPENPAEIRRLQNEVALHRIVIAFVLEVIEDGRSAWESLRPEEAEELRAVMNPDEEVNDA